MYKKIELHNLFKGKIGEEGTIAGIDIIDDASEHAKSELVIKTA
ncbi:MAG: hypothetical protein SFH39_15705 [Candidatus Magnetobacterium sp. LHC-1]|nr:hypothetical protein [Candidatus Magnetobacterium casensis]